MTLNDNCKNWLADNAGTNHCYAQTGIAYTDPDGIERTGGTGDVANAFYVAHLIGKDTVIIIADTNYSQLKIINESVDLDLDDVRWVYNNDGHIIGMYCSNTTSTPTVTPTISPTVTPILPSRYNCRFTGETNICVRDIEGEYASKEECEAVCIGATPTVTPTSTPTVTPTIPPSSGRISCTTSPSRARIFVDDIDLNINTPAITGYYIWGSTHKVTFKLDGYNDCDVYVEIPMNSDIVDASCDLIPIIPTVTPTVTPTITPTVTPTMTPPPGDNTGMLILGELAVGIGILYYISKRKKRYK